MAICTLKVWDLMVLKWGPDGPEMACSLWGNTFATVRASSLAGFQYLVGPLDCWPGSWPV